MTQASDGIIVTVSYPNQPRKCKHFITALLKKWVAKCVQRHNYVKSYYIREDKIKKEEEKILVIKSTQGKQEQLIGFIKKLHPYDTPEIIVVNPSHVDQKYLDWLNS